MTFLGGNHSVWFLCSLLSAAPYLCVSHLLHLPTGHGFFFWRTPQWKEILLSAEIVSASLAELCLAAYSNACTSSPSSGSLNPHTYQGFSLFTQNILQDRACGKLCLKVFLFPFFEKAFSKKRDKYLRSYLVSVLRMTDSECKSNRCSKAARACWCACFGYCSCQDNEK